MQPFDRHPADAGALADSAQRLAEQAAHAIDAARVTLHAFAPAPQAWDGIAAAELRAAPDPVRDRALAISGSLSWASVAVRYWSMKVRAFNSRVNEITTGLAHGRSQIMAANDDAVTPAQRAHALQALEAQARKMWWTAYNADIVAGARTAASMVEDGPTGANVNAARAVGLLPLGQPWHPLYPISQTFKRAGLSPFDLPFPLMAPLGQCPLDDEYVNNFVEGATDGAALANALQLPFKDGLAQMLGGEVGNAGVDAVNDEMGTCIEPIDLPQPPEPPRPQQEPAGFLDGALDAVGDVGEWADTALDDANDWVDQAAQDVAWEIDHLPPMPPFSWPQPELD